MMTTMMTIMIITMTTMITTTTTPEGRGRGEGEKEDEERCQSPSMRSSQRCGLQLINSSFIFYFLFSMILNLLGPGWPSGGGPRMDRRVVTNPGFVN